MQMSEKKFSSKDLLGQLKPTPDLAYEFSNEEVLEGVKFFIRYVGYNLEEPKEPREGGPDFCATRTEAGITYRVVGVLRRNMKEVADGIAHLEKVKAELGEEVEYAVVVPPVQERHLIDYMMADNYKLYRDLQQNGFMLWLCNPQERSMFCSQGASRDRRFNEYFRMKPAGGFLDRLASLPYRGEAKQFRKELMDSLE
jgi:hypothetical protein